MSGTLALRAGRRDAIRAHRQSHCGGTDGVRHQQHSCSCQQDRRIAHLKKMNLLSLYRRSAMLLLQVGVEVGSQASTSASGQSRSV